MITARGVRRWGELIEARRAGDRRLLRSFAKFRLHLQRLQVRKGLAGSLLQKICDTPQIIHEDFGIPLPIFVGAGAQDRGRMQCSDDRRETIRVLNLAMRLGDSESCPEIGRAHV